MSELHKDMKTVRTQLGLTQQEVAFAIGRTRMTYIQKEAGRGSFTTEEFIQAVNLFAEILKQINYPKGGQQKDE